MAEESLVLLENKDNTLPIHKNSKVLLVGENLNNIYYLLGDYTSEQKNGVTICDAFQAVHADFIEGWNFIDGITVSENELEKAIAAVDVIIFGCGGSSVRDFESDYNGAGTIKKAKNYMDCGEGLDLAKLELVPAQIELLKKIKSFGKPVITLAIGGRAYTLSDIASYSDALIWCGYPGQCGANAIYNTIYGDANNFGRLSVSFPKHVGQLPIVYNYKKTADYVDVDKKPLYPFGYGLSYSNFAYSDFIVTSATHDELQNGKPILVSVTVENTSEIIGKEVVQLYINRKGGTVTHRIKEFCGFNKITLLPHEKKTVEFEIGCDQLKEWSTSHRYELYPMSVNIMIGKSSDDILYEKTIRI